MSVAPHRKCLIFVGALISLYQQVQGELSSTFITENCSDPPPKFFATACKITELDFNVTIFSSEDTFNSQIQIVPNNTEDCCEATISNHNIFNHPNCTYHPTYCTYHFYNGLCKTPYVFYDTDFRLNPEITKCPKTFNISITKDSCAYPENCPLVEHLAIGSHYYHEDNQIRLNISWEEANSTDINVKIESRGPGVCYTSPSSNLVKDPHLNRSLIRPHIGISPEYSVNHGCQFKIKMSREIDGLCCLLNYTVPECVGSKCNCESYSPQILSVNQDTEDTFLVRWALGLGHEDMDNNITGILLSYYNRLEQDLYGDTINVPKKDLDQGKTVIKVNQLKKGEDYVLKAVFNSFECHHEAFYTFNVPENYWWIVIAILLVALVVVIKHKTIIKYVMKISDILPINSARIVSNSTTMPLATFGNHHHIPMQINVEYTPCEFLDMDEYEFPRSKIQIKEVIGRGAFGQVFSAKALDIGDVEGYRMVAVKTLCDNITQEAINDFRAEINIFKKIGEHPNIVRLLGCCTLEVPYMMIMEFAPCGDLKSYLVELRQRWTERKNNRFSFDNSDGAYILPPSPYSSTSITSSRLPSTSETVSTSLEDPMTPLLSHFSYALEVVLDSRELQNFALQIAQGMAHLESIPITHRDLAARNILINEFKQLKISDFGLSRTGPYINHKRQKLPLRWMAVEAIVEQTYDSRSDVWSFGVVLWEIGTLGGFPYENVPDSYLLQFLSLGRRLERPEVCTDELYALMRRCWEAEPEKRPTFQELVEMLNVKKRNAYVDFNQLNPTYVFPPCEGNNAPQVSECVSVISA